MPTTTYQHSTIGEANKLFEKGPLIDYLSDEQPCYVGLGDDGACALVPYSEEFREDGLNADDALRGMADRELARLRGGGHPASAPKGPPKVGSSEVCRVQNFPPEPGSETPPVQP
jgi:hypothetical protein